jgi:hypothetical protein
MYRIRPRTSVLSGAAIGLIAGATVYGAVSAPSPTFSGYKPVNAIMAVATARAAGCAAGQKLEHGVCIIHVVRTVVVPATASAARPAGHVGAGEAEHADDAADRG